MEQELLRALIFTLEPQEDVEELLRTAGRKSYALDEACVLRTPCLEVPNHPEPPMIHHVLVLR